MYSPATDLTCLALLLERLLDADALLAEDGATLQAEVVLVRQSLALGDPEAARQHIERLTRFTEALVQTDALDPMDGRAILEIAHGFLAEDAG